jgi:hypothetical protein
MSSWRSLVALAAAAALLLLAACGGGDQSTQAQTELTPRTVARANATCRYFRRQAHELGQGVLSLPLEALPLTVEHLVKPGIPLVRRVAKRQQALARQAADPQFTTYADLFDPIIVLLQQRLRSGEAALRKKLAVDPDAQQLDDLLADLGEEQRLVAHEAGLRDCDTDFNQVLTSSISN